MGTNPLSRSRAGSFQPSRMLAARLRRGFTVNALAEAMGSHRSTNFRHDAGLFTPNEEHLRAAARALRFPERFFLGDDIGELAPEKASFRSSSKLVARQRDMALGTAGVAIAFNGEIERLYALPEPDFPDLAHRCDPEQAAEFVRRKWDLDERPIENIMQLLESRGVRVFSLPVDAADADSFSIWHRDRPFVFLNTAKRADERHLDLAHELGHLLLHRYGARDTPKTQQAASAFASALLIPAAAICADAPSTPGIAQLLPLAQKWGVPLTATARRLHRLALVSDWQYRRLRMEIAEQPSLSAEEGFDARERPLLLQRVFASLRARGVTKHKIASTVGIYPKDLDELTFGLALISFNGEASATIDRLPPRLTVVTTNA